VSAGRAAPGTLTGGPWFEDLEVGQVERGAPGLTLTDGHAAAHQAITGDRLALALDAHLCRDVAGGDARLAHPALVWDVAIGQSTGLTQRVIANLFYRGLTFRRLPVIGDTLRTRTEVVGLRQTSRRAGRVARGLAALRITTLDQRNGVVLDFWRCAMLPLRDPTADTGRDDDLARVAGSPPAGPLAASVAGWRLAALKEAIGAPGFDALVPGASWAVDGGDVVSAAPELARLTLNLAVAHHDRARAGGDGRRLVYGGHTIAIAAAQAARVLPTLATIVAWHDCEHLAPVFEGDTLRSRLELERREPLPSGGGLAHLRSRVRALGEDGAERDVLDWRFVAVLA
jgi:acyl dehydratase